MQRDHGLIILLGAIFFLPFLGSVHLFDWDEINFAESAREMLVSGDWWRVQINFEPFWEKPPLFFWMQAISMKVFGVNEFAARFPNAICGILTLLTLYQIGSKWQSKRFGWLWVLLYLGSFLPHLYFKSGIIDPWFNLFIFLSIYHLFLVLEHGERNQFRNAALAGLFSGLSILTKGPVGFLLLLLTLIVWLASKRFKSKLPIKPVGLFSLSILGVCLIWFGFETAANGPWFLSKFIEYQIDLFLNPVAGHKQPFFYHFLVVLIGCFPMSILAIPAFFKRFEGDEFQLSRWMKYLFWVVLILFSIVTTKIVHYSSMTYLPLSYLAALAISKNTALFKWQRIWIAAQGTILGLAITAVPILLLVKNEWIHLVNDPFVIGNLNAAVSPIGWELMLGIIYIIVIAVTIALINKSLEKGLTFLLIGTAVTILSTMTVVVPMIESLSQRSAIQFFEQHANENAYITTYGYKSYAQYFYGNVNPSTALAIGSSISSLEKPIYVSVRINKKDVFLAEHADATLLSESGGFSFFVIPPDNQ